MFRRDRNQQNWREDSFSVRRIQQLLHEPFFWIMDFGRTPSTTPSLGIVSRLIQECMKGFGTDS